MVWKLFIESTPRFAVETAAHLCTRVLVCIWARNRACAPARARMTDRMTSARPGYRVTKAAAALPFPRTLDRGVALVGVHSAAVRCDMVLHQGFCARQATASAVRCDTVSHRAFRARHLNTCIYITGDPAADPCALGVSQIRR